MAVPPNYGISSMESLWNLIRVIASPQIRAIHDASIFTRSITLTVQTLHLRRLHLHMTLICWFNLLPMHTISPWWWFQPVGTCHMHNRERTRTNLLSHAAQSTRSSFNPLWPIDLIKPCKSNRSNLLQQHITYMLMIQTKNYARWPWYHCRETGRLRQHHYRIYPRYLRVEDHRTLPLDAQRSGWSRASM
jgi:hypothetical protein